MDNNNKNLKDKYLEHVDNTAPDMDTLWNKIESRLDEKEITNTLEIKADENTVKQNKIQPLKKIKIAKLVSTAAAVVVVFTAVNMFNSKSNDNINLKDSSANDFVDYNEDNNSEIKDNDKMNYQSFDLAKTATKAYDSNHQASGDDYFVEDSVLKQTDFFADVRVTKTEIGSQNCTYTLEVINIVTNGEVKTPQNKTFSIQSDTPYLLREGREYFIPFREEAGDYKIVFENAPQIEITNDGYLVYHNGWKELDKNSGEVIYPQSDIDDFFYDRMRFSHTGQIENLIEKWKEV